MTPSPGQIVILNGAPRSGKSSIAAALQACEGAPWMALGVDAMMAATPPQLRPGIGLRPGGERPDLEPSVAALYRALYDSIAAFSRLDFNVVVDVGHHDHYSRPLGILPDCARRLATLPVLFVGVHCPLDVIVARRAIPRDGPQRQYLRAEAGAPVPAPILLWQEAVHAHGLYDLELDTSKLHPDQCAAAILERLGQTDTGPRAFAVLAGSDRGRGERDNA